MNSDKSIHVDSLLDSFVRQKDALWSLESAILHSENEVKQKDEKIHELGLENRNMELSNDELLEKIEVNQETQSILEKELLNSRSSKSRMILTMQAMISTIESMEKSEAEQLCTLQEQISKSQSIRDVNENLHPELANSGNSHNYVKTHIP